MARYTATVDTAWDREEAFDYLADFANISAWDPGVVRATRHTGEPLAVGARFEVTTSYMGRESTLVYETVAIDRPRRVVLRAETGTFTSLDTMTFDLRPGGGTLVTYDADLAMKGLARLAELPMRLAFRRIGDAARDGLRTRLAEAPPRLAGTPPKTPS
jgi:carbon monoxide dehydrogenase subunit G